MSDTLDHFIERLRALEQKFTRDRDHYASADYSEAQLRVDFINPLFKALGWDVENEAGLPPHERECVVERGETAGRPDYNFRVGGQTRFFVEVKAPHRPLSDPRHIVQAKGYAWNTREVFFVVLTNFEEIRLYDASIQPDERRPDEGLLMRLESSGYLSNAVRIWELAKVRVSAGSLESMLPRDRRAKRLRIPVDESFLEEMTEWRVDLARDIHKHNPDLTAGQLNDAVQRLLDRIVFIRIAEDRRIIEKRQLSDAVDEWRSRGGRFHILEWLNDLFRRVNDDFNGEIFKPHISEELKVSSEVLARIIDRLYPPKSPYRFDVIGVELLGSIYERYLGNTLRPTAKQVVVREKPEVRKAGGVYYTPKFIVDYIVREVVGPIVDGKTPRQIQKIRILDPACGSGSFLIGAFQFLIDYHVRYYAAHPEQARKDPLFPDLIRDDDGGLRLSVRLKAEILRNNLYGVDKDPQAVEITMMSLYLKALEGERSLLPPKHSLLPELKYNVLCGNSLVGPDVYLIDVGQGDPIHSFDWGSADGGFGDIMTKGGFDCVVANPPYIRIQTLQEFSPQEAAYLKTRYSVSARGNSDIYIAFVQKGLDVLRKTGRLGFILPSKFFQTDYGEDLRRSLIKQRVLDKVVDFGHSQVFDGPTTYTCLLFLARDHRSTVRYMRVDDPLKLDAPGRKTISIPYSALSKGPWVFANQERREILGKVSANSRALTDLPASISRGSSTGADDVFIVGKTERSGTFETRTGERIPLESGMLRIPLYATDFGRYRFAPVAEERIIFPYVRDGADFRLMDDDDLAHFPHTLAYLRGRRHLLEERRQRPRDRAHWYAYSAQRNLALHDSAQLLVPLLADRGLFSFFPAGQDRFCLMASGGFSITINPDTRMDPRFILGVLNSRLMFAYLASISNIFRGGWITCTKQYVGQLPIRVSARLGQAGHDRIVDLVERLLAYSKSLQSGRLSASEVESVGKRISVVDSEVDDAVCQLYGVTPTDLVTLEDKPADPEGRSG